MTIRVSTWAAALGLAGSLAWQGSAEAGVIRVSEAAFTPAAGLITFSEKPIGTLNPIYSPGDYGGGAGAPTVSFEGYFLGQSLGGGCGGAPSGCVTGLPSNPLALDPSAPNTFITQDGANPTSPVLSGSPLFNGPIAILFSTDQYGVGLDGGYFDALGGTAITAFARDGSVLGSVANVGLGIEFLGLVTDNGSASIAGLLFSLVGPEPAGFAIDNLRFGVGGQVINPTPEPVSLALFAAGLMGFRVARRRA
ncbi:PEP-CTERM sorting domain-containing protein [Candidatus Methylocalor cossyra]|uniref:PEP-CTERM exosortase interaction domain protein n=1 Tax=Candidatus Methylocalor cossyra TaxID=3108543 RepID=A0ABP1C3S6_9GAMM